jgi:hypothetical protein
MTKERREKILNTLNKYREINENGCYGWTGSVKKDRFPCIYVEGKSIGAHRAAWMAENGKIPRGHFVHHTCKNKACTNPEHLYVSSHISTRKKPENRKNQRIGRERLAVDLPISLVESIREMARKYHQTVTKYLFRRLSDIVEFEKNVDFSVKSGKNRKI